jgi:hypothetical protein
MTFIWWILPVLVLVSAWYLSFSASRLDRLHHRVETSWAALDAALQRRAGVALELAVSGLLDPAESVLLTAASHDAREGTLANRAQVETDLTVALMTIFPDEHATVDFVEAEVDGLGADLMEELREAVRRVEFAHALHADAVESTRIVREKGVVRLFRLAGHAGIPRPFDAELVLPSLD